MNNRNKSFKTPSWTSPKGGKRGCICADNTYSVKCCNGSLQAQGIGNIYRKETNNLLQEDGFYILQEDNSKIIL